MDNWDRIVLDVCNIFNELTGAVVDAKREQSAIIPWIRDDGFTTYEFRLIIEHCLKDERQKQFLSQPGRMNLRSIFNSAQRDRLLDLISDLKRLKQIKEKFAATPGSADIKINKILMNCGHVVDVKYFRANNRWEKDLSEYNSHHLTRNSDGKKEAS